MNLPPRFALGRFPCLFRTASMVTSHEKSKEVDMDIPRIKYHVAQSGRAFERLLKGFFFAVVAYLFLFSVSRDFQSIHSQNWMMPYAQNWILIHRYNFKCIVFKMA